MDKSLDEIISARPRGGRRGGGRRSAGRQQILGTSTGGVGPTARAKAAAALVKPAAQPSSTADKIIVSNLPADVNEQQIKELFHTTVGPLRNVTLHYDSNGRSKGVAAVQFSRSGDGNKAYAQYNNRLIDGKRAMKIEIVVDPARPASLVARVAPATATAQAAATGGAPARTGGRPRRGRGGRRKNERPAKSAADLDAEMEDYTASNATPSATAT